MCTLRRTDTHVYIRTDYLRTDASSDWRKLVRRSQLYSCKCLKTIAGTSRIVRDGIVTIGDSKDLKGSVPNQLNNAPTVEPTA
jgi:hypothetical protein